MGSLIHFDRRIGPELKVHLPHLVESRPVRAEFLPSNVLSIKAPAVKADRPAPDEHRRLRHDDEAVNVLQFTDDAALGRSRELVLSGAGCSTQTILSTTSLEGRDLTVFRVGLICQSVCTQPAIEIASSLRRLAPHMMLLRIVLIPEDNWTSFDAVLPAPVRPSTLQSEVLRLAEQGRRLGLLSTRSLH